MADFTDKQTAFIAAYLGPARYNAREAARQAGYQHPESSAKDNMALGYKVREEIEKRLEEDLPSDSELLRELASIATAPEGDEWVKATDKRQAIKDIQELRGKLIHRHEVSGTDDRIAALLGLDLGTE